jgi:hypothetical protein
MLNQSMFIIISGGQACWRHAAGAHQRRISRISLQHHRASINHGISEKAIGAIMAKIMSSGVMALSWRVMALHGGSAIGEIAVAASGETQAATGSNMASAPS